MFVAKVHTWKGLEDFHHDYTRINQYSVKDWIEKRKRLYLDFNMWLFIGCSITYFLFFGTSREARRRYKDIFNGLVVRARGAKYVSSEHNQ